MLSIQLDLDLYWHPAYAFLDLFFDVCSLPSALSSSASQHLFKARSIHAMHHVKPLLETRIQVKPKYQILANILSSRLRTTS